MPTNIVVPALGESVTEATVSKWLKKVGDSVAADDPLVELETDKVTLEVPSPMAGMLAEIKAADGSTVAVGAILGVVGESGTAIKASPPKAAPAVPKPAAAAAPPPAPATPPATAAAPAALDQLAPAVRKLVDENGLDPAKIPTSGKDGRLTKGDVIAYLEARQKPPAPAPATSAPVAPTPSAPAPAAPVKAAPAPIAPAPAAAPAAPPPAAAMRPAAQAPREERVRMTRLRRTIAVRLKEAQNTAAMLTTFNEADMGPVMAVRNRYKDTFEKKHGVRLGFMSFFAKACVVALREVPSVNAQIDGDDLVYKNHYDFGIAIGSGQGLVVPVVRDVDSKSFAQIEKDIAELGRRARDGKLTMEDLTGGTFTITNGGIYGSLNSTPILNPPQSAILGMHKIQDRPVAVAGKVEIRPMMYLAVSYDHRVVDGREAVTFLVRVKECIEDPERILLDM
ncbi:MAG TPA: 2-oxoglutarate dehydrogenase complex dihydrolipoyllysine-residue succinyltransferase [Alphaproteobacteria bacterium]|nr:2-oxoglutarate dehydrogenase complex dihydrolipoyllysine-residue succinyltransferase [Alphaproteobacteria bacterium]